MRGLNYRRYEPGPDWTAVVSTSTNPAANDVEADTGQLAAGSYEFMCHMRTTGTTNSTIGIQHRDAANTANNFDIQLELDFDATCMPCQYNIGPIRIEDNERLRMQMIDAHTGVVGTEIWYRRVR